MKRIGLLFATVLGALPAGALAMCYTVYGANQVVIWRGTDTPIDLSRPIHEGMRRVFPPGSRLLIEEEMRSCTPIGTGGLLRPAARTDRARSRGPGDEGRDDGRAGQDPLTAAG